MPVQRVETVEEKARNAGEMRNGGAKRPMLEIAELYRSLAEQTAKLVASEGREW